MPSGPNDLAVPRTADDEKGKTDNRVSPMPNGAVAKP